ncbi:hypothetical protein [Streptomyces sp. RFCAC02]|uniref:hypothetical protein n=1 Tax=Streptomyces sp. RFCAC02 TaxID=2499143 RepID=UPI001021B8CA|nr:hypothetical protein [Streptomyces sp. RFCAC02]
MTTVTRLVTHTDLDGPTAADAREVSLSARLEAVLADGRRVVLLADRGWGSTLHGGEPGSTGHLTAEDIEDTARMVVGPDEPVGGGTPESAAAAHWAALAARLGQQGVAVTPGDLERLPHDVVFGAHLRAWLR